MRDDTNQVNSFSDYSRSNHYYSLACQESNSNSSKNLLEDAVIYNHRNYDARIDLIFLDHLPIEKEVANLVALYEEIKEELITSSFFKNKKGVFSLHEEGKSFLRLINHILDDYSSLNKAKEIIKYAEEALSLDISDTLELKKYLAFSFLSLNNYSAYLKLKESYPNNYLFLFTDCYYYILKKNYIKAYENLMELKNTNNWIANYILFNESKNIINIYNSEKETPVAVSLAVDFIISSYLISKDKIAPFHLFVSSQLIKTFSLTLDEKRFLCCLFKSYLSNLPTSDVIQITTLSNLKNNDYLYLHNWLIHLRGNTFFLLLESLQNKGVIFSYNEGYKFTYSGIRLLPYFKEEKITKRLFKIL